MNRLLSLLLAAVLLIGVGGCGDSQEKLAGDANDLMKDMVALLEGVKDPASAKAAKPKLQAKLKEMKELQARQEKLPAPTDAEKKAMADKYDKEMQATQQKFIGEMMRIAMNPALSNELKDLEADFKQ